MGRSKRYLWSAVLAGVTLLVGGVSVVTSQETKGDRRTGQVQPGAPLRLDRGKNEVIERPVKNIVVNGSGPVAPQPPAPAAAARPLDISKTLRIEPAVKNLVATASAPARTPTPAANDKFVNPKVQPGKVRWHATLADARAAASKSKKPVLLFQMMGKLDDQFC